MKKLFVIIMTVVLMATIAASASGEAIEREWKKVPNYVITIGGDKLIDIQMNHHFVWVEAIGEGWNATKNFCVDTGVAIGDTAVNAYNGTINWIKGIFGGK